MESHACPILRGPRPKLPDLRNPKPWSLHSAFEVGAAFREAILRGVFSVP